MESLLQEDWFRWALGLTIAFPLAVIILGEIIVALEHSRSPLVKPLGLIRNLVLPMLVLWLFVTQVLFAPSTVTTPVPQQAAAIVPLDPATGTADSNASDTNLSASVSPSMARAADTTVDDPIIVKAISTAFYLTALLGVLGLLNALVFRSAEAESWRARVPDLFLDLSRFILVLIATAVILSLVWGADLGGLLAALGVGSIVVGLALQETLGNVFSGIAILFEQPYKEGDWVRVNDQFGKVETINWRTTRLKTYTQDTIVIPNGTMASAVLMNESHNGGNGFETIEIGFSYDNPPNFVKQVLLATVNTTELVLSDPTPQVWTKEYGDSAIVYSIRFAVRDLKDLPAVKDSVSTRLWYAAKRNGLNIPFPIRTVFNYDGETTDEKSSQELVKQGAATVTSVLPVDAEDSIADDVQMKRFGRGETIIHSGSSVKVLYLVVSGTAKQSIVVRGQVRAVRRISHGEIFGAAEVLRSISSHTKTIADTDIVLVAIPRETAMHLVRTKHGFARQLEEIIETQLDAEAKARDTEMEEAR